MRHASCTLESLIQLRNAVNLQKKKKKRKINYVLKKTAAAAHVDVTPPVGVNWATSFVVVIVVTTLSCKWHVVTGDTNNNARVLFFAL